jgi:prolyl-tRNA synthetase
VAVLSLAGKNEKVAEKAEEIYETLWDAGIDTILDDRTERPGVKFNDADLIGYPMQLVVGGKGLERGVVEAKDRRTGVKVELALDGFLENFERWHTEVVSGWGIEV